MKHIPTHKDDGCRSTATFSFGAAAQIQHPVHPYPRALLTAGPDPDPNARLDLALLREGRASDPGAWAPPFTIDGDNHPGMIDLGNGHLVRAKAHPALLELAS